MIFDYLNVDIFSWQIVGHLCIKLIVDKQYSFDFSCATVDISGAHYLSTNFQHTAICKSNLHIFPAIAWTVHILKCVHGLMVECWNSYVHVWECLQIHTRIQGKLGLKRSLGPWHFVCYTVEPLYNEVLGTMKITLLYQVSHIRVKKQRNIMRFHCIR